MELAAAENTLFALLPTTRIVPTTITRMTTCIQHIRRCLGLVVTPQPPQKMSRVRTFLHGPILCSTLAQSDEFHMVRASVKKIPVEFVVTKTVLNREREKLTRPTIARHH